MKKYNNYNSQWVLLGIIGPILMFFLAMNTVFAYFTATATPVANSTTTGIINIGFTDATTASVNSSTITESTTLIPGETLEIDATIKNNGTASLYAIVELNIYVTKVGGTEENVRHQVYTITTSGLQELTYSTDESKYTNEACALEYNTSTKVGEEISFTTSHEFGFYDYDNTYQNATIQYKLTAYAIQKAHMTDAVEATNLLVEQQQFYFTYQQVEFIESTGTQYINTGFIPNQNSGFDIEFLSKNVISTSGYGSVFGARTSSQSNEFQITTYTDYADKHFGTLRFGKTAYNAGIGVNSIMNISLRNGVYTDNSGATTTLTDTFTSPCAITVFALNENGTVIQYGKLQLYSFKLYDGNTIVRNFVPCYRKSDGEIGLYDKVTKTFYTNAGTGTFTKGADI